MYILVIKYVCIGTISSHNVQQPVWYEGLGLHFLKRSSEVGFSSFYPLGIFIIIPLDKRKTLETTQNTQGDLFKNFFLFLIFSETKLITNLDY